MTSGIDACPGVLTLHPARDGHVARIRLPGGYVSERHWRALAALSRDFGDGSLDLTARGNVQIRGVDPEAAAGMAARALSAGLLASGAHDRARNITASPLAGLGGRPPLRGLIRTLDAAIVADPALATLPGRFLFAVDDGSGGSALARSDVGLLRSGRLVEIVIAGRLTGVRVRADSAVSVAVVAARAAVAAGVGSHVTRIRDLADGGPGVASAVGGTPGAPVESDDARLLLGQCGSSGETVIVVAAPLGRLTGAQLELVGSALRAREVLRLANAGRIVIPVRDRPELLLGRLADAGVLTSDTDTLSGVTACSGTACSRSLANVRVLARPLPRWPRTHWAGCSRGCGAPSDAELVAATGPDTFEIGGQAMDQPALAGAS